MTTLTKLTHPVTLLAASTLTDSKVSEAETHHNENITLHVERRLAHMTCDQFTAVVEFLMGERNISIYEQDEIALLVQVLRSVERSVEKARVSGR
jgi:hypothetical protein